MSVLKTIFAGTPEFAVPALKALINAGHAPLAVLTQPDRAAGRGRKLRIGPVKQCALEAGIDVLQPVSLKTAEVQQQIARLRPDLLVTAAYGLILPAAVLNLPTHGCWNLHASLLPRWRGASPINQAVLAGDAQTGISLMQMDVGLDTGPVLLQKATGIEDFETAGDLHDRLSVMAAELLIDGLDRLVNGRLPDPVPQDDNQATHAPLIQREDARLDWRQPAELLARQVRAYYPWPMAFGEIEGLSCRIFRARSIDNSQLEKSAHGEEPGRLIKGHGDGQRIIVACGEGALAIELLQAPGRCQISARDWLNAHPDWM